MTNPLVVNGFPVPPVKTPIHFYNEAGQVSIYVLGVPFKPKDAEMVYIMQSIGYRAWMDEAERRLKAIEDPEFDEDWSAVHQAERNAETCRTWTPKGETK